MNIISLEDKLEKTKDSNMKTVLLAICNAVSDYPKFNLLDTNEYFSIIRQSVGEISLESITEYEKDLDWSKEENIWIHESLNSLIIALEGMRDNKIEFADVLDEIEKNNC